MEKRKSKQIISNDLVYLEVYLMILQLFTFFSIPSFREVMSKDGILIRARHFRPPPLAWKSWKDAGGKNVKKWERIPGEDFSSSYRNKRSLPSDTRSRPKRRANPVDFNDGFSLGGWPKKIPSRKEKSCT